MIAKNRRPSGKYERADSARLQATEGRGFSRKLPQWDMCDPTGRNGHTTAAAFVKIESAVRDLAEIYGKVYVTLAESDKCKLTVLNGAQGRDEGGEACLQAHRMHIPRVVSALNTGEGATSWLLGQEHSDESRIAMVSLFPTGNNEKRMKEKYCELGRRVDLSEHKYRVTLTDEFGNIREVENDLERFGHALKHWQLVLAWHLNCSDELVVGPDMPNGFIAQKLREIEMAKINMGALPECFHFDDIPTGMRTPFGLSYLDQGIDEITGMIFQMKIITENKWDTYTLRNLIEETRKGWAGVLTGILGQSDGNTFLGGPANDKILITIAQAFHELGGIMGNTSERTPFHRVAGHTIYNTEAAIDPREIALELIKKAEQMLPKGLRAVVTAIPVDHMGIDEVKARLEACWMSTNREAILKKGQMLITPQSGLYGHPLTLPHVDQLLNMIEFLKADVMSEVVARVESTKTNNGRRALIHGDRNNLALISEICRVRRTVRGGADFKAILMHDDKLKREMKLSPDGTEELWKWTWNFSARNGRRLFNALTETIEHL